MLFLSFLLCFYIFLFFVYLQGVLTTFLCMYRLGFLCLFKVGLDRISLSYARYFRGDRGDNDDDPTHDDHDDNILCYHIILFLSCLLDQF